jgi:hypothetical protein
MKVLCFAIHGIGQQQPNFAGEFTAGIHRELDSILKGLPEGDISVPKGATSVQLVEFESLYWSNICEGVQANLFRKVCPGLFGAQSVFQNVRRTILQYAPLKKLSVNLIGDIFSYLGSQGAEIKSAVFTQLKNSLIKAGSTGEPLSVVIIGHSLGSVIIHDLLSQMIRYNIADFQSLSKRTSIFTMGSPVSLFSLVNKPSAPIEFKNWVNFWHPRDAISLEMNALYANACDVKLGSIFQWHPGKTHSHYWTNRKVHKKIAEEILDRHRHKIGEKINFSGFESMPPEILERDHGPSQHAGLSNYLQDFSSVPFHTLIPRASKIDFCNIYGGSWLDRNAQHFVEALCRPSTDVRACIIDPESAAVSALAYHFRGKKVEDIQKKCHEAIQMLKDVWVSASKKTTTPGRLRVYSARTAVNHSFYRFDETMFYAPRPVASSKLASTPIPAIQLRTTAPILTDGQLTFGDWLLRDFEEILKDPYDHNILFDSSASL